MLYEAPTPSNTLITKVTPPFLPCININMIVTLTQAGTSTRQPAAAALCWPSILKHYIQTRSPFLWCALMTQSYLSFAFGLSSFLIFHFSSPGPPTINPSFFVTPVAGMRRENGNYDLLCSAFTYDVTKRHIKTSLLARTNKKVISLVAVYVSSSRGLSDFETNGRKRGP